MYSKNSIKTRFTSLFTAFVIVLTGILGGLISTSKGAEAATVARNFNGVGSSKIVINNFSNPIYELRAGTKRMTSGGTISAQSHNVPVNGLWLPTTGATGNKENPFSVTYVNAGETVDGEKINARIDCTHIYWKMLTLTQGKKSTRKMSGVPSAIASSLNGTRWVKMFDIRNGRPLFEHYGCYWNATIKSGQKWVRPSTRMNIRVTFTYNTGPKRGQHVSEDIWCDWRDIDQEDRSVSPEKYNKSLWQECVIIRGGTSGACHVDPNTYLTYSGDTFWGTRDDKGDFNSMRSAFIVKGSAVTQWTNAGGLCGTFLTFPYTKGGGVRIKKNANPASSIGQDGRSLAGAQYTLFTDANCRNAYTTLTTNAEGKAWTDLTVPAGTYYLKETKAPAGYKRNDAITPVSVSVGNITNVENKNPMIDEPLYPQYYNPVKKVDKGEVKKGDLIEYTIEQKLNKENSDYEGLTYKSFSMTDIIPDEFDYVSSTLTNQNGEGQDFVVNSRQVDGGRTQIYAEKLNVATNGDTLIWKIKLRAKDVCKEDVWINKSITHIDGTHHLESNEVPVTPVLEYEPPIKTANVEKVLPEEAYKYTITYKLHKEGKDYSKPVYRTPITITDVLPEEVDYVSAQMYDENNQEISGNVSYDNSTRTLTWSENNNNRISLTGKAIHLDIHVKASASIGDGDRWRNKATLSVDGKTMDSNIVVVGSRLGLSPIKSVDKQWINKNAEFEYTITQPLNESSVAYAVFDSEDGSLTFFRGSEGKYTNGQVKGTKTYYTGFETDRYPSYSDAPWYEKGANVTSVIFEDTIKPLYTDNWFRGFTNTNLTTMDLRNLDTAKTSSMQSMFHNCQYLTTLNLSNFKTSSVTDMRYMFYACYRLRELNVSSFDTSNVTGMNNMFSYCRSIPEIDLSHFDTSKVTSTEEMFKDCFVLTELDVSHFDTSSVTNMKNMFAYCRDITSLDVSHFDTSNVTNMGYMFRACSNITSLDVSHFDTSKVTDMRYMFSDCANLTNVNLNYFNTSRVWYTESMFESCYKINTTINIAKMPSIYTKMFYSAASDAGGEVKVKYVSPATSQNIDTLISTKPSYSNVVNAGAGSLVAPSPPDTSGVWNENNPSPVAASGSGEGEQGSISFSDPLPERLAYVSGKAYLYDDNGDQVRELGELSFNSSNNTVTWSGDKPDDGATVRFKMTVKDTSDSKDSFDNVATVTMNGFSFETNRVTVNKNRVEPVEKTASKKKVRHGEEFDYVIKQKMPVAGKDVAKTVNQAIVNITDSTPNEVDVLSYTLFDDKGNAGESDNNGHLNMAPFTLTHSDAGFQLTSDNPSCLDGRTVTVVVHVKAKEDISFANSPWANTAESSISVYGQEAHAVNETSEATAEVSLLPVLLKPEKEASKDEVRNDEVFTYTITQPVHEEGVNAPISSEAYAVFDSEDGSLTFFRDDARKYTNSQVDGTKTYFTGLETINVINDTSNSPWLSIAPVVKSVKFKDIISPVNTTYWFYNMGDAEFTKIDGLENLNTSKTTSMRGMFYGCKNLTALDVSRFDTSNVTDMRYMFYNCKSLTALDVSHFDTSNVTDMRGMFYECNNLTSLDVSYFNTSKVTNMGYMFNSCNALTALDVSHFDTSNVTDMNSMFGWMHYLQEIDISHFDTSSVTNMETMFSYSRMLTTTLNVANMPASYDGMFTAAAWMDNAQITLKRITPVTSENLDTLIGTKDQNSNIINGGEGTFTPPEPPDTSGVWNKNNPSPAAAKADDFKYESLIISDILPEEVEYISASAERYSKDGSKEGNLPGSATYDSETRELVWTADSPGNIKLDGGSVKLKIQVRNIVDGPDSYDNEAVVTLNDDDLKTNIVKVRVKDTTPIYQKPQKDASVEEVDYGQTYDYTITHPLNTYDVDYFENNYNSFVFSDPLPDEVEYKNMKVELYDKNGNYVEDVKGDFVENEESGAIAWSPVLSGGGTPSIGQTVSFAGRDWVVVKNDAENDAVLVLHKGLVQSGSSGTRYGQSAFSAEENTDWEESPVRKFLYGTSNNSGWIDELQQADQNWAEKIKKVNIESFLPSNNGSDSVFLLSSSEYTDYIENESATYKTTNESWSSTNRWWLRNSIWLQDPEEYSYDWQQYTVDQNGNITTISQTSNAEIRPALYLRSEYFEKNSGDTEWRIADNPVEKGSDLLSGGTLKFTITVQTKDRVSSRDWDNQATITINGTELKSNIVNVRMKDQTFNPVKETSKSIVQKDEEFVYTITQRLHETREEVEMSVSAEDIAFGSPAILTASLPEDATGNVIFTVNETEYPARVEGGIASVEISDLAVGTHNFTAAYTGNGIYLDCSAEGEVTVTKAPVTMTITAESIVDAGDDVQILVDLPERATGTVSVTMNDEVYTGDINGGQASILIPSLEAGEYNYTVSYGGDENFENATVTGSVVATKSEPEMTIDASDIVIGEDAVITVNLPEDATGTVTLNVDGNAYTETANNGTASFTIENLELGTYTVEASYEGNKKYFDAEASCSFTVKDKEAYAVYDSADNTLRIFKDAEGKYTNRQTDGTKTYYTGIETSTEPKWYEVRKTVAKVIFEDVISPINTSKWFYDFGSLTSIENLEKLDTSKVTDMSQMFAASATGTGSSYWFENANQLNDLDLSSFDTSNVTNMESMFTGCINLFTLNLDSFETSKVTNMRYMFRDCSNITTRLCIENPAVIEDDSYWPPRTTCIAYNSATGVLPDGTPTITLYYKSPMTSTDINTLISACTNSNVVNGGLKNW